MKLRLLIFLSVMVLAAAMVSAQTTEVVLESVSNVQGDTMLSAGNTHAFDIRVTNVGSGKDYNVTNGFRIYSTDGATWDTTYGDWLNGFDAQFVSTFTNGFSITGSNADTIGFAGLAFALGTGLIDGWDAVSWRVTIGPTNTADSGKHICIDSCWYRSSNTWKWAGLGGTGNDYPDWSGDTCFMVTSATVGVDENGLEVLPDEFALAQNYPNPFNPTTVIEFDVPERAHVTITVYNVLGQKVTTLIDEEVAPQFSKRVEWDGRSASGTPAATGIYFYKLETDRFVKTKKMMLLK